MFHYCIAVSAIGLWNVPPNERDNYTSLDKTSMGKIKNPDEKRKGGRPRLSAEEKHSYHYHVGYNEIDHNTLVYQAQQANQTVQHYLHDAPLVKVVQAHMREDQIDMVGDLAKMGGNVNQIAHKANAAGIFGLEQVAKDVLLSIKEVIARMVRGGDLMRPTIIYKNPDED